MLSTSPVTSGDAIGDTRGSELQLYSGRRFPEIVGALGGGRRFVEVAGKEDGDTEIDEQSATKIEGEKLGQFGSHRPGAAHGIDLVGGKPTGHGGTGERTANWIAVLQRQPTDRKELETCGRPAAGGCLGTAWSDPSSLAYLTGVAAAD